MGFVEGEGCFSIGLQRYLDRKPRKTGIRWSHNNTNMLRVKPNFRVTIREADNEILWELKGTLGVGNVYTQRRKPPWENASHYYAQSKEECAKVREFFEKQRFYTRKGQDFQLWCKCLDTINSGQHLAKEGLLRIIEIRDQMNARGNKKKRSSLELLRIMEEKPQHIMVHMDEKEAKLIHNKKPGAILQIPEKENQAQITTVL